MSYVGNTPAEKYLNIAVQHFSTSATTSYTLNQSVGNENEIALFINNVRQQPGNSYSYTASGTTLTLSQATAGSDAMYCVFLGKTVGTIDVGTNAVNTAQIVDNAVTSAKIVDNAITTAKITDANITTAKIANDAVDKDKVNLVSTSSSAGLEVKGDGTTDGYLQLNCNQNTHGIKLKSPPHSASADYTLTFPNNDGGTSQFLQTNGSGVLTWADAGGGGKINQVQSTTLTTTTTASPYNTWTDIAGMTVAITPAATSSKVNVDFRACLSVNGGNENMSIRLMRDSTAICIGTGSMGSRDPVTTAAFNDAQVTRTSHMANQTFLDSPNTTSATTYKLQWRATSNQALYLNRSRSDANDISNQRTASTITVMEVLA